MDQNAEISAKNINKKDLFKVYIRSFFHQGSWNYERMQALGYCFDMVPIIRKLYKNQEDRKKALKRHLEFFNTHQFMIAPILGITVAMEEKNAQSQEKEFDDSSINAVKVGLMGPLAGVGDPVFLGTLRPLLAALGAGLALKGSLLGPLLFLVLYNVFRLVFLWTGLDFGYRKGVTIIQDIAGNTMKKFIEAASILGLFVMGALVNQWTTINVPLVISQVMTDGKMVTTTLQNVLDSLMPGLLPLGLTFLCIYLFNKKVSPLIMILGLFIVGIAGRFFGILA